MRGLLFCVPWPGGIGGTMGIFRFQSLCVSGGLRLARWSRAGTSQMLVMVFELLIWSVDTSEVSMVPGCWLLRNWKRALFSCVRLAKALLARQNWLPMVLDMFAYSGCSGSTGGFCAWYAMWQKPQDMATRKGRTRLGSDATLMSS